MTTKSLCWRDWDGCLNGWHNWSVINGDGCGIKEYGIDHYLYKESGVTGNFLFVNNEFYSLDYDPPLFHAEARMHSAQTDARGTWGFHIQDFGGSAGGLRLERVSDTLCDLQFFASDYANGDDPQCDNIWYTCSHLDTAGIDSKQWHTYSFDTKRYVGTYLRNCGESGDPQYVTYGLYTDIKVDGVSLPVQDLPNSDQHVSNVNGGVLLYTYITSDNQLSNYGWGLDNMCVDAIYDRNKYNCFPKWKQTIYGMRPSY